MKTKEYLITISITILITIGLISNFGYLNTDKSELVLELENQIENLQEQANKFEDDKLFYKQLYINLAEEYGNETNTIILTDTSR